MSAADVADITAAINKEKARAVLGVRPDRLQAYIGSKKWKINPLGHTRTVRNQLIDITDEYGPKMRELEESGTRREREDYYEGVNKRILDLALVHFDYDTMAEDQAAGPVALGMLARELEAFLVDQGGATAVNFSLTLQNLATLIHSASSLASPKSTRSLPDTSSASAQ